MKRIAALALLALCGVKIIAHAIDSDGPVHKGTAVQIDFPQAKFVKNTGGMGRRGPGTGAGLCVFTSIQFAAEWANVEPLKDFQKYMMDKPGGGWPGKVDQMITAKCGPNAPAYMQYEGKDPAVIRAAVNSGRVACVTYDGRDNTYHGHIEHMVCVVHYDDSWVVILDNNQGVDRLIWLTPQEFVSRWIGVGRQDRQGWAVILLAPGCPPCPPGATPPAPPRPAPRPAPPRPAPCPPHRP